MHLDEMGVTAAPELGVLIFPEQENILRIAVFLIVCFCPVTIRIVRGAMFVVPRLAIDVGTLRRKVMLVFFIQFRNTFERQIDTVTTDVFPFSEFGVNLQWSTL